MTYLSYFALMDKQPLISIGNKIRERRKQLGLTQSELAKKASVSLRTIQRIEKGETEARVTEIIAISTALNVSIDSLV